MRKKTPAPSASHVAEPSVLAVREMLNKYKISKQDLSRYLGASLFSISRWERGDTAPSLAVRSKLVEATEILRRGETLNFSSAVHTQIFASRGARVHFNALPVTANQRQVELRERPGKPIIRRLMCEELWGSTARSVLDELVRHRNPAKTIVKPFGEGISAGKNTYTYDAHTYHTKVPPQGIAELLRQYLPKGGLVLDPFAGSGMTGVAARTLGMDVILNELSPAASFIADRFSRQCDPVAFATAVRTICDSLIELRKILYTTLCRTCGKNTEILYTVWSYQVLCSSCSHEFILWDHCRMYGKTIREHKILSEFPCPRCRVNIKKSRLRRTKCEPVFIGYKCCSRLQVEHPLSEADYKRIRHLESSPILANDFFPKTPLPDGVNLCQPKRHGLDSIDQFYTTRNLSAMSHLWQQIHKVNDDEIAGFLAFVFTSLYQRVTRLSEYRFWGGSGNTANFNVPYIFNEANVFVTFERKARSIQDHLSTTANSYRGRCVVRTGSATHMPFIPNSSVDLIFTDPPFGANINYSEMNILWESWLGKFTDAKEEAIVNKSQNKGLADYERLMKNGLQECYRVLRPGHWMLLVFMNSSEQIWNSIRNAVLAAGFSIERVDIFDKQHGTFKQFVSDNTAGCDLLLHCRKVRRKAIFTQSAQLGQGRELVQAFLNERRKSIPKVPYIHVNRAEEIDYRMLYSEFLAERFLNRGRFLDFSSFRDSAAALLND